MFILIGISIITIIAIMIFALTINYCYINYNDIDSKREFYKRLIPFMNFYLSIKKYLNI